MKNIMIDFLEIIQLMKVFVWIVVNQQNFINGYIENFVIKVVKCQTNLILYLEEKEVIG